MQHTFFKERCQYPVEKTSLTNGAAMRILLHTMTTNHIHSVLKYYLEQKSQRDQCAFTVFQLAKAMDMPHSILVKLMHEDPTKRVQNPRIDTLVKIVEFFRAEGFFITLDDFFVAPRQCFTVVLEEAIDPIFKAGSVFEIDTKLRPTDHAFVAVRKKGSDAVLIRQYRNENGMAMLHAFGKRKAVRADTHDMMGTVVRILP